MFNALLVFAVGCLILAIVVYIFKLILGMLDLPGEVKQIVLLIVSLIALIFLILLTVHAFQSAGGHPVILWP